MGKRILGITVIIFVMSFLFAFPAYADGGFFGPEGSDISEPEQKAVIFFNEGTEELVLSVRYDGASEDFAWLVPTPEPPVIEESSIALFQLMSTLTPTSADYMKDSYGGSDHLGAGVEVLEELTVGAFDLTVLRASDAGELGSWLDARGFVYEAEAEGILADYIERGWCFTAMRIDPFFMDPASGSVEDKLSEGTIDPLRFTFNAPEPVYPLRISSLNPGETEVLLYVLAPQAYGHASLELEYAEKWQPGQIGALREFSELASGMESAGGCCITKLRATYSPGEMEDLYLSPLDPSLLEQWPGLVAASQGGDHLPWWAFMLISLAMALVAGITYRFAREDRSNQLGKTAAVFTITLLVSSAVLLTLGIWVRPDGTGGAAAPRTEWPWQDDILVTDGLWLNLIHPDGQTEIVGLAEDVTWMMEGSQEGYYTNPEPGSDIFISRGELDGEGKWKWGIRHLLQGELLHPTHLRVEESTSGEFYEVEIAKNEYVLDVRFSPDGNRLWAVIGAEVPERKTEAREFIFPGLEFVRAFSYNGYMAAGEIVMSQEGEPLLAGRFESVEENSNVYFGFIHMLEENAAFVGETLVLDYDRMLASGEPLHKHYLDSYFCDPMDASFCLLLFGSPENSQEMVFVLDTSDGRLYEVGEGYPVGWQ